MIAHRDIFVVRQQRIIRTQQLPRIGGVVDTREEVGVVADLRRQMHRAGLRGVKQRRNLRLLAAAEGEQLGDASAQRATRLAAQSKERVERRTGGRFRCVHCVAGKKARRERGGNVENLVPDRDAGASLPCPAAENSERQILNRKIGMSGCRRNKAASRRIVSLVACGHHGRLGSKCFFSPCP